MKSCLIVDDSKVVRKFTKKIIEDLSFQTFEACDGSEALELCAKSLPDIILLDWNMPVMDGMEFLIKFRAHKEYAQVMVIFCTTMNNIANIQQAMTNGANEYIMKPFDAEIIKSKFIQMGLI